jgi:hypothetical protein
VAGVRDDVQPSVWHRCLHRCGNVYVLAVERSGDEKSGCLDLAKPIKDRFILSSARTTKTVGKSFLSILESLRSQTVSRFSWHALLSAPNWKPFPPIDERFDSVALDCISKRVVCPDARRSFLRISDSRRHAL